MTVQMYDADELTSAQDALETLMDALPGSMVLLGGWAVYHTVIDSYIREHDIPYLGSRDIDVGFHVDPAWSDDELRSSAFSRAIDIAKEMGYDPMGSFRFCRFIQKGTGRSLTEDEAKRVPIYDLFYLYLDIMVANTSQTGRGPWTRGPGRAHPRQGVRRGHLSDGSDM